MRRSNSTHSPRLSLRYFYNVAKFGKSGDYKTLKGQHTVHIHPSSVLSREDTPPRWLCYHEVNFTSKEYMRNCTEIKGEWLIEIAPHYFQKSEIEDSRNKKMPKGHGKAGGGGGGGAGTAVNAVEAAAGS